MLGRSTGSAKTPSPRMASVAENADDAIIGTTLDGITTSWNPAAEELFGYSNQDIIGEARSLRNIETGSGEPKPFFTKSRAGQPVEHLETKGVRKDGTPFKTSVTMSPT